MDSAELSLVGDCILPKFDWFSTVRGCSSATTLVWSSFEQQASQSPMTVGSPWVALETKNEVRILVTNRTPRGIVDFIADQSIDNFGKSLPDS